jgi:nucleosome binding factor SPN SPT16 subunit
LTILTSEKKAKAFENDCKSAFGVSAAGGNLELSVIVKDKSDGYAANYAALIAAAQQGRGADAGPLKVGTFTKSKQEGAFVNGWEEALKATNGVQTVDVTSGFAVASAAKDEKELLSAKNAARLSAKVMKMLKEDITSSIDEGKPPSHASLSRKYEKVRLYSLFWTILLFFSTFDSHY